MKACFHLKNDISGDFDKAFAREESFIANFEDITAILGDDPVRNIDFLDPKNVYNHTVASIAQDTIGASKVSKLELLYLLF
jgi:hypothetical protein